MFNVLHIPIWFTVSSMLVFYVLRLPIRSWWGWSVAVVGVVFFVVAAVAVSLGPLIAFDYRSFWQLGRVLLSGGDSLDFVAGHELPPLNPPTAYPWFAAMALLPFRASLVAWMFVSAAGLAALVPLAHRILVDRGTPGLPGCGLALVTAAFMISNSPRAMIQSGQLAFITAFGLIAALACQSRGRPGWAGFWLVQGTLKPNTTLPFLLLFLRRRDIRTWVVSGALITASLLAFWGTDLRRHATVYLQTIEKLSRPGGANDISLGAASNADMVGLDYAFYRLGLRAPGAAGKAQIVAIALLGAALAFRILRRPGALPTGGDCSLVALFSVIFLYHRSHDCVVLALPLTYAVARARAGSGQARWAYLGATAAVLLVLSHQRKAVELLSKAYRDRADGLALLVQAIVLPYATWLVLGAMIALALGDRWSRDLPILDGCGPNPGRGTTTR